MSISGRCGSVGPGEAVVGDQGRARVHLGIVLRVAAVPLGVVRVVQPPVGDRGAGDRRVEDVRAAQHGERGEVTAVRPAADADPGQIQRDGSRRSDCSASTWSSRVTAAMSRETAFSQAGEWPGVPRPSATTTAKPWSANHWEVR